MSIGTPNLVEADEIVKGLPDDALRKAAQFGHQMVPPVVALHEITRRKDMRQRYEKARNKMPDATIKDQILGANPLDGGVMSNVPQISQQNGSQNAYASTPYQPPINSQMMDQRPPVSSQMRPQGMMPQMASTGAVVRANQGMPIDYMGDMERLSREMAESRERAGLSNEYLRPSDENIRPSEILNLLGTGEGIRPSEILSPLGTGEVEPYLNPSDQGIGKGNAVIEDALKFNPSSVDELFLGERGMEGDAGLFDPDWKTPREQLYGGETILASTAGNDGWSAEKVDVTPDNPPAKPAIEKGVADPYTKEILQAAKAEAFQLTDEDIAAFTPSKDDILSGFLMNYGASLAGGDHAGGLKKGIASVAEDKKSTRSANQLKTLANMKAKQAQATAKVDALYKAGSLDISELTANVSSEVEQGRLLRAYSDAIYRTMTDRQYMTDLKLKDPNKHKKILEEAENIRRLMSILANRNVLGVSHGGIASIR